MELAALVFIIGYLVTLLLIGVIAERRSPGTPDIKEFFIASGRVGPVHAFLTALATGFSAFTFLGGVGLAYGLGLDGLVLAGGALVLNTPAVVLVGKRLWALGKRYSYLTPSDFLADRFPSSTMRVLVAAIAVVFSFFYIQVQFVGMGFVISVLTGDLIAYSQAVVIVGLLTLLYVALGGMRAVIWTDALQAVLLIVGMLVIAAYALATTDITSVATTEQSKIFRTELSTLYLWTVSVGYGLSVAVWPQYYVRYFASRDRKGVFGIGVANDIGCILLLTLLAAIIGFAGIAVFPDIAADTVTIRFVQAMPLLLAVPMAAAATAAAQSTADSILLTVSSIGTKDVYMPLSATARSNPRRATRAARLMTVVLAIVAMLAALQPPELILKYVLDLAYPGFLLLLPPTVAGLYWRRATTAGAISGLCTGLVAIMLTTFVWSDALDVYPGIWGLVVNSLALVLVSLATPPPSPEVVERIHGFLATADYPALEAEAARELVPGDAGTGR